MSGVTKVEYFKTARSPESILSIRLCHPAVTSNCPVHQSLHMNIALPQQPTDRRVLLPPAPGNPPALADVHRADKLKRTVLESAGKVFSISCLVLLTMSSFIGSFDLSASTIDDVGRAVVYEHCVTHAVAIGMMGQGL